MGWPCTPSGDVDASSELSAFSACGNVRLRRRSYYLHTRLWMAQYSC